MDARPAALTHSRRQDPALMPAMWSFGGETALEGHNFGLHRDPIHVEDREDQAEGPRFVEHNSGEDRPLPDANHDNNRQSFERAGY